MYLGGEVAGRALDIGAGGLLGRDAPAERFDLQESVSAGRECDSLELARGEWRCCSPERELCCTFMIFIPELALLLRQNVRDLASGSRIRR